MAMSPDDPEVQQMMLRMAASGVDPYEQMGIETPDTDRDDDEWSDIRKAIEDGLDPRTVLGMDVSDAEILEARIDNLLTDAGFEEEDEEEDDGSVFGAELKRIHGDGGAIGM